MRPLLMLCLLLAACATAPASPADVFRRVAASAVVITTSTGSGSGTVILHERDRSLVLTAQHVVAGAGRVVHIQVSGGAEGSMTVRSRVLLADRDLDLALLESAARLPALALPVATDEPALYELVYSVAAPMGLVGTAWPALLSAKIERAGAQIWEITGFTFFGSSGGTVANARGELVGVPVVIATWNGLPIPQVGFAVPLPSIRTFLDRAVALGVLEPEGR